MNAAQYLASKIKNRKTNVSADGLGKFKLEGFPKSLTPTGIAELATEQTGEVKVSLPKAEIRVGVTASQSGTLTPKQAGTLVLLACEVPVPDEGEAPQEPEAGTVPTDREEQIDEALNGHTNGKGRKKAAK